MVSARPRGSDDPRGFKSLTVLVHGYNNSEHRALARWDDDIFPRLRRLTSADFDGLLLYFWPGDAHRLKAVSSAAYPWRVRSAIDAGVELAEYLTRIAKLNDPKLTVRFVGHSLGCRVVVSALQALAELGAVPVEKVLLMGAAVPEGDCDKGGPYQRAVATAGEVVLHSASDTLLRHVFPVGERVAQRLAHVPHVGSLTAVGLFGGPSGRWPAERDSCGLEHDEYWKQPVALGHVATMFGSLLERRLHVHTTPERRLDRRELDERRPDD